jgi:hypothetical protein
MILRGLTESAEKRAKIGDAAEKVIQKMISGLLFENYID